MRKLETVYEGGVLRPTEKLPLEEHQLVSVIILDADADNEEIEFEPPESFEALANHSISRETVRAALSKIPGSLEGLPVIKPLQTPYPASPDQIRNSFLGAFRT